MTLVGSQPAFFTTTRTCHVSSPSAVTRASWIASSGSASACATAHAECGATSASISGAGAFDHVRKKSHPPSSTGPSCGCSNGYQSTKPAPPSTSSFQRSSVRSSSTSWTSYHSMYFASVRPAARSGLQNSVVQPNTPRKSYAHSSPQPPIDVFGSYLKSWNTETVS